MLTVLTRRLAGDLPELVKDPLGIFTAKSLLPEGVAPLAIGLKRGFLIGDLGLVRHVLLDNAANYDKRTPAFGAVRVVLGNGLLTSGGPFWKRQRRITTDEETGEPMSDRQLRDEVMTLLIAGHETTASGLAWAWYLLDRHPDEQERLRAELTAAVGRRGPTVDDLPSIPRFRLVINETLRLYPPVWMFDRRALGPDRLGRFTVRRGDLVIISPYGIHRNPALWSDPETFHPERFEPGREEQKNKFAFLAFGAGARQCMGMSFAMMESQIILGTLLARFRARLWDPADVHPRAVVTLRPDRPILLRLERV